MRTRDQSTGDEDLKDSLKDFKKSVLSLQWDNGQGTLPSQYMEQHRRYDGNKSL